jgi:biopolymer transport protein ExbB
VVLPARRTLLQQAGPVGVPLVGLALAAVLMTLVKVIQFLWSRWTLTFVPRLNQVVGVRGEVDLSRASTMRVSGVARHLLSAMTRFADAGQSAPRVLAMDIAVALELQALQRGLGTLKVIAAAAPLLGLLGTVSGMIETFEVINTRGTGDARALSGGIAEALVTTEMGLWIAIPTVLLHTALAGWAERLSLRLSAGAAVLASFEPDGMAGSSGPSASRREDEVSTTSPEAQQGLA